MARATQDWCAYRSAIVDPISKEPSINPGQNAHVPKAHIRHRVIVASNNTPSRTSPTYPPNDVRLSLDSTVVKGAHGSSISINHLEELVDSMENFRFTTMVTTTILNRMADLRTIVDMTSNNLLNAGWDLLRLYMLWSEITADASSADVVGIVRPWSRLSKERVANACQNMKHALATHQAWTENMNCSRTLAETLNLMSNGWWVNFGERHRELAMLDPQDIADQVAIVMEMQLGIKEEVATPTALTRQRSLMRTPSTQSPSAMRSKNSFLAPVAENTEMGPLEKTRHSIATSHWTRKPAAEPQVPRWSLPTPSKIPRLAQHSSSRAIMQRAENTKQVVQEIPNFSRPTKPNSMARQSLPETNETALEPSSPPQVQPQANAIEDAESHKSPTKIHFRVQSRELPISPLVEASAPPAKAPRPMLLRSFPCVPSKIEKSIGRSSTESHRPLLNARRSDSLRRKLSVTLPRNYASKTL